MTTKELHEEALGLAKVYRETDARLLTLLSEMQVKRAFYELGHTGIWEYCFNALKLSEAQSFYFQKVVRKALVVPELKQAMQEGTLSLAAARHIEPVITKENSAEWLDKANTLSIRELERQVRRANPNARKKDVPQLQKNLERLMALLGKSKEEVLLRATEVLLDKVDPERKAERAVLSARKAKPPVAKQGRQPIPAATKHRVVLEQGYQCAKCKSVRHLNHHHIEQVRDGGTNVAGNIQLLCYAHHRIEHARSPAFNSPGSDRYSAKALSSLP